MLFLARMRWRWDQIKFTLPRLFEVKFEARLCESRIHSNSSFAYWSTNKSIMSKELRKWRLTWMLMIPRQGKESHFPIASCLPQSIHLCPSHCISISCLRLRPKNKHPPSHNEVCCCHYHCYPPLHRRGCLPWQPRQTHGPQRRGHESPTFRWFPHENWGSTKWKCCPWRCA